MTGFLLPLEIPTWHHGGPFPGGDMPPFIHLLGGIMFFLFLLATVGALLFLSKTGRIGRFGPPPWVAAARAPETEAKKILADRFANGTIDAEEFMERASVLNWTPGSEAWTTPPTKKRKR